MINIIFTRKKLCVGVKAETSEILQFNGQSHISFDNRNMRQALSDSLPLILHAFREFTANRAIALTESLPVSLVFPVEAEAREKQEVRHFLEKHPQNNFELLHTDDLVHAYLYGLPDNKNLLEAPCIVLEALDGFLSAVYYHNTQKEGQPFVVFSEMETGDHPLVMVGLLEEQFSRMGFALSEEEKRQLTYQHTMGEQVYSIRKANGIINLDLKIQKSDLLTQNVPLIDKPPLSKLLSKEQLESYGIRHIILLGEILKQEAYGHFFENELDISGRIWPVSDKDADAFFRTVVNGLSQRMENSRAENNLHSTSPNNSVVTRPNLTKHSEKNGPTLISGFSYDDEWKHLASLESLLKSQELEERRYFKELKAQIKKQRKLYDRKTDEKVNVALVDAKVKLGQIFDLIKEYPKEEFATQLVLDKNLKSKKVLRFISNENYSQSTLRARFLCLYEKEAHYYSELSNLFETEEGKFYFRDYFKGDPLEDYLIKAGLVKKTSVAKFTSRELEFIFNLIQTVKDLPISHCNISAENILVQEKLNWNLQNGTSFKFVGFTSNDCTREDMINRMHDVLGILLAPGVYKEFRNKLKL